MKNCEWKLNKPLRVGGIQIKLERCEAQIDSIRKLLTWRRLKTSSWFSCSVIMAPDKYKVSTIDEYICMDPSSITPVECDIITSPGILSFDIEAHSFRHNSFPVRWSASDVITTISIVYEKFDTIEKYLITQCKCNPIEGAQIFKVSNEIEIIRKFEELVRVLDPEIITGYNILGFDWDYMNSRLNNELKEWECMGRIKGKISKYDANTWSSSAYGDNSIKNIIIDGRITIDMMLQIKRDYKFQSYSLNNVSRILLGKQKLDMSAKEMFEAKDAIDEAKTPEEMKKAIGMFTLLCEYNIVDSELVLELFKYTMMWITSLQFSNAFGIPISFLSTRGQQVRVYSQIYDECAISGIVIDKPPVQTNNGYVGAFVMQPIPGRYDNVIILDFLSLYPTIMISKNICYSTLVPSHITIPDSELHNYHIIEWSQAKKKPKKGEIPAKDAEMIHHRYLFLKKPIGVFPRILKRLLSERLAVKRKMKLEEESSKKPVLNIKQKALKVVLNSSYGLLGASSSIGKLPLATAAMCITAIGRMLLEDTNKYIEKNIPGAMVIYNDTDSAFVSIKNIDPSECRNVGVAIGKSVTRFLREKYISTDSSECNFEGALELEFEKTYAVYFVSGKKNYVAILRDPISKELDWDKPSYTGGTMIKRDTCRWVKRIYDEILMAILKGQSRDNIDYLISVAVNDIMSHTVDVKDLVINKKIGSYSETSTYFLKPFADRLSRIGKNIQSGDRVNYIVIEDSRYSKVGFRLRLKEEYDDSRKGLDVYESEEKREDVYDDDPRRRKEDDEKYGDYQDGDCDDQDGEMYGDCDDQEDEKYGDCDDQEDEINLKYDSLYYALNALKNCIEKIYTVRFADEIKKDIERIIYVKKNEIVMKAKLEFDKVSKECYDLVEEQINDIVRAEATAERYKIRLISIEDKRDKELKSLPKANMKWGRKLIYSGPSIKPVERAVRIRKAFDLVMIELLKGDNVKPARIRKKKVNYVHVKKIIKYVKENVERVDDIIEQVEQIIKQGEDDNVKQMNIGQVSRLKSVIMSSKSIIMPSKSRIRRRKNQLRVVSIMSNRN